MQAPQLKFAIYRYRWWQNVYKYHSNAVWRFVFIRQMQFKQQQQQQKQSISTCKLLYICQLIPTLIHTRTHTRSHTNVYASKIDYLCVHMLNCNCLRTCLYIYTYIYLCGCVFVCQIACVYVCVWHNCFHLWDTNKINLRMCSHASVQLQINLSANTHTYVRIYWHIYNTLQIHLYIQTHIYIRV